MRGLLLLFGILALGLQGPLWLSDGGYRKTRDLRQAVNEQLQENDVLRLRNGALEAEVLNLKQGHDAAEERARTDLGMIGKHETFFQVVPASAPR
jgi:cell division protein FtsB